MISLTQLALARRQISLQREITDVHNLIRSVRQLCQVAIDDRHVRFEMQLDAPHYHVLGDAGRLQQVFWNLLSNAIKFTSAGGTIVLGTSVVDRHRFRIRLTDSGRGINSDLLERIFQPFEQGDLSVPSQFGGLGLGLAISKGIVDAHEGQIQAESLGLDRGATFTVTLPLAEPKRIPDAAPPRPKSPLPKKAIRILLVDDHQDTLEFMSRFLTLCGHQSLPPPPMGKH